MALCDENWGQNEELACLLRSLIGYYSGGLTNSLLNNITDGEHDQVTIGAADTTTALSAISIPCEAIMVKAHPDNDGIVTCGMAGLDGTNGFFLNPNDSMSFRIDDVDKVYVRATGIDPVVAWYAETLV